jgi:hypothetical protein
LVARAFGGFSRKTEIESQSGCRQAHQQRRRGLAQRARHLDGLRQQRNGLAGSTLQVRQLRKLLVQSNLFRIAA